MARITLKRDENVRGPRLEEPIDLGSSFEDKWPTVYAYVMQDRFEDGSFRQTSTLLFFLDQGRLKVCLSDRQCSRSLFRSSRSVDGCLDALEEALTTDTADWKSKRI